jgi:multidrug efflux pump subunit AcrA (membrane-fusion protein)
VPDGGSAPAARAVHVAHAALRAATDAAAVLSIPFDVDSALPGVLIFESADALDEDQRAFAQDAAMFIGPVLMLKARLDASWPARARARWWQRRQGTGIAPTRVAMLAGALGLVALAAWPTSSHVVAQARVEGLGQRIVTAPADGFLRSVAVRPGETVHAGQVLATLDDREPKLEYERAEAERTQYERQYRDALARDDAGQAVVAAARLEQAQAQFELARSRLERTRLAAPFDGVLIGGDLGHSVGMPVKRGQELMVVAPATGWRIVAEVDEIDVTTVQPGQKAQALFGALAGSAANFEIERLAPVAVQMEGRNVFEAEGRLAADAAGLRPGLRGVVRIEAGERSPATVWWSRIGHWLRRLWWTVWA